MGFIVHRSERADVLADALANELAVPLADPFRAEVVAVHAKGIERWLANRLAARLGTSPGRADGVCANLALPFPGRLVGDALARATGVDPATDPWRPERLVWPLLAAVDANLDEPWLHVLAHHLGRSNGERSAATAAAKAARRFAAVRHIADLYDRYAVHRPDMLRAWADGRDEDGAATRDAGGRPLPLDAAWQAELWRRLRDVIAVASPPERLAAGCAALLDDPSVVDLPDRFFLFGLTRLPVSYLDVLSALAVHRDVHLLALHPSPELWATLTVEPGVDATVAAASVRHPLLRAWGRDSREMALVVARRLADASEVRDIHHPLAEPAPATLLHQLQYAIRHDLAVRAADPVGGSPDARPALSPDDRTMQIHRCHGRTRQAEVVRDAITHLLADDDSLQPRDIVVMCPDIDDFAPLLRAAFDGAAAARDRAVDLAGRGVAVGATHDGPPAIPYRLADRSLRQTNPVLGAVAELLALADSRLTATQVLSFAALAPVRDRFGFDDDDLETLARWIGDSGIRWGLDAAHRSPYDLAAIDTGTWDAGLRRLLLGVAMAEEDSRLVGGVLPLDDVDSGDIDLAGRVAELIGRLAGAVASLTGPLPVGDWMVAVDTAANALFATRSRDAWQRQQLDRLVREVGEESGDAVGGDRDGAGSGASVADRPTLRLEELRDLLADRLRGQPTRAAFRTGDLTLCTLVPMRSVPHRVVCLVGLDDGSFPRGGAPDGDDLLSRPDVGQPGDHDRRSEDRQLLLDAVLAATDALVITYAGRDPSTNEVRPPAVPVNELLDVLDATATAPSGPDGAPRRVRDLIVHDHPLQPADRRYFAPDALELGRPWGFDPALLAGAAALADPAPASAVAEFLPERLAPVVEPVILVDDLVRFVEHPVQAFLRQRLGLSLKDWDDRPLDRITIELDNLGEWGVGNRVLLALLAGGDADAVCAAERARGLLPPGGLGDASLAKARDKAVAIAEAARQVANGRRTSLEVDLTLPDGRQVVGAVPDVLGDIIRPTTFSKLAPKRMAGAWVRFLAVTATHPERELSCTLVGSGGRKPATVRFAPLGTSPDERRRRALERLAIIVDLRDRGLCEALPLASATSHRYATQVREGNPDAMESAAGYWTSSFDWDKEDRDAEHVRVFGGQVPFAVLVEDPPTPDEAGPGWSMTETTRFGRLARRLWDPILEAAAKDQVQVPGAWR